MNVAKLTPRAEQDLREAVAYISRANPTAAVRIGTAILDTADFLAMHPGAGRKIQGAASAYAEVRWFVLPQFRSYLLFYKPTEKGIIVIRMLHAARDWTRFFDQS